MNNSLFFFPDNNNYIRVYAYFINKVCSFRHWEHFSIQFYIMSLIIAKTLNSSQLIIKKKKQSCFTYYKCSDSFSFFLKMFKTFLVAFFFILKGWQHYWDYKDRRVESCEKIPGPRKVSPVSSIPHLISTQLWLFFYSLPIIQFLNSLTDWHTICSTQLLLLLLLLVLIYHCGSCQNDNCSCCNVNKSAAQSPPLSLTHYHSVAVTLSPCGSVFFICMVVVYSCFCFFLLTLEFRVPLFSVLYLFLLSVFCLFIAFFGCCFRCCTVAVAVVSCFLHLLFNNLHVVINKINTYGTRTHTGKETGTRTQCKVENGKNVLRTAY